MKKRKKLYTSMVAASFAVMAILAFAEKYIPAELYKYIIAVVVAVFFLGVVLMYVGLRCPKCKKNLGMALMYSHEKTTHCPRCGFHLEDEGS